MDTLRVPDTDPGTLLRARDGIYADDLLIAAVAHLDLFTFLADQPCELDGLASRLGLAHRPADVMCTLFRAMGLLAPGPTLRPTALAAEHLVRGSPFDLRPYLGSLARRPVCLQLLEVLRTDRSAPWASTAGGTAWADGLDDEGFAATITAAMDARGACLAPVMAAAIADLPATSVLDVAGGSGTYARALLQERPAARATILERPPVDAVARRLVAAAGCAERVTVVSGDMFVAVPEGHDLHLLSHTLHDWGGRDVRRLLEACFDALAPGGWLVDHDAHVNRDKTGPLPVARYSVLLMHTTAGKCWSVAELEAILEDVGFGDVEERSAGPDRSVVLARKPTSAGTRALKDRPRRSRLRPVHHAGAMEGQSDPAGHAGAIAAESALWEIDHRCCEPDETAQRADRQMTP